MGPAGLGLVLHPEVNHGWLQARLGPLLASQRREMRPAPACSLKFEVYRRRPAWSAIRVRSTTMLPRSWPSGG